jgi:Amt family ammonium transporter
MNSSPSECLSLDSENQELQCVIDALTSNQKQQSYAIAVVFITFCSVLIFLMQAGFAMICSGCVRKKNVQNTMLKSLLDGTSSLNYYQQFLVLVAFLRIHFICYSLFSFSLCLPPVCGSSIAFYFLGYAFAFGGSEESGKVTFIGSSNFLLLDGDTTDGDSRAMLHLHWFFHFGFAATAGKYTLHAAQKYTIL